MDTTTLEQEMLNCPDCQLQTLQQQQQQQQQQQHEQSDGTHLHLTTTPVNSALNLNEQMQQQQQPIRNSGSYDGQNQRLAEHSSLQCSVSSSSIDITRALHHHQNNLHYKTPPLSSSHYSTSPCGTSHLSMAPTANTAIIPPNNVPVPASSTELYSSAVNNTCLTPLPTMDTCDLVSGYCATCAVLDIPTNDKYYRSTLSRHSVFPSMFYSQPPIPGFSPVPDCSPWTNNCNSNDFGPYSYPPAAAAYAQQSGSNEFYSSACSSSSSMPNNVQSHIIEAPSQIASLNSCAYSFANPTSSNGAAVVVGNTSSSDEFKKQKSVENDGGVKRIYGETDGRVNDSGSDPIPISISSSSSEDTSDSESYVSQREVIVEDDDDDDDDDGSVSMSICNMVRNQRCVVCHIPILADCSSPQLVNILENIHEDITAEDLDISVSSGDIEIGGIEDEVRDFPPKKSLPTSSHLTYSRLAYLLNAPVNIFTSVNEASAVDVDGGKIRDEDFDPDSQTAALCSKCGKLAGTVDALEKQLKINCITLQQLLQPHVVASYDQSISGLSFSPSFAKIHQQRRDKTDNQGDSSGLCSKENCDHHHHQHHHHESSRISASTQTEPELCLALTAETSRNPPVVVVSGFPSHEDSFSKTSSEIIILPESGTVSSAVHEKAGYFTSSGKQVSHAETNSGSPKEIINFRDIRLEYCVDVDGERDVPEERNKDFDPEESTMAHLNLDQDNGGSFPCPIMSQSRENLKFFPAEDSSANSSSWLPSAMEKTTRQYDLLCEECGKFLSSVRAFEVHLKRHHGEFRYQCNECLKCFVNVATLKVHLRSHTGEKPFSCNYCDRSFSTKSNLNSHLEICKPAKNNCKKNDRGGSKSLESDFEYNRSHSKDKLTCDNCGISFRLKERLALHQTKGCKAKVVECSHCQKKFTKTSELRVHMLVHEGMKPFYCDVCGMSFATKGNQIAHTRLHSDEKRFKCHICDKGFNRKQALQLHVNRHNGLKPFTCDTCDRKFSDPSNLQNHKKIHGKN